MKEREEVVFCSWKGLGSEELDKIAKIIATVGPQLRKEGLIRRTGTHTYETISTSCQASRPNPT